MFITMRRKKIVKRIRISVYMFLVIIGGSYTWNFVMTVPHDRYVSRDAGAGCVIPRHDPFDPSVMEYFNNDPHMPCDVYPDLVFVDRDSRIQRNTSALNEVQLGKIKCGQQIIERKNEDEIVLKETDTSESAFLTSDCVKVSCSDSRNNIVYQQLLFHTDSKRVLKSRPVRQESQDELSVLIYGVDSVSQLAAIRTLPKTLNYLRNSLEGYVFKGYTKIGENSFPNLVTLLAGHQQLSESLYKNKYIGNMVPFIWKNFSEKGYVTMFSEESPTIPNFNTVSKGFQEPPTDHYFRPCALGMDTIGTMIKSPRYDYSSAVYGKLLRTKQFMYCNGNRPRHLAQINYFKSFLSEYTSKLKFAFSWHTALAHEDPNYLKEADNHFKEFLEWSDKHGHLNNSILFFLSDHGSNINSIRNTAIGRVEERMPIFIMVLPTHLKQRYPHLDKILRRNTQRLTTHLDGYQTIRDILFSSFGNSNSIKSTSKGISLFKDIPADRTCADALIPVEYCPCHKYVSADIGEDKITEMSQKIVEKINEKFKSSHVQSVCHNLTLKSIVNCQKIESNFVHINSNRHRYTLYDFIRGHSTQEAIKEYTLSIRTSPSDAMFEAVITISRSDSIKVSDTISRTNRYGNQSYCVQDKELKPYCFCK